MNYRRCLKGWLLVAGLVGSAGCLPDGLLLTPVSTQRPMQEQQLYSESFFPDGKIAVIPVEGVILNMETSSLLRQGEHPVSVFVEQLDKARKDPQVKAVVLRVNSPGGSVTASELMHTEITRFRKTGRPVVAMMMDVAASGAYYASCATDEIMACHSTVTGSIGVIMQLFEFTGTMQKIGVTAEAIKSAPLKAGGSPFEKLSLEDRAIFQDIVHTLYGQFVDVVAAGRSKLDRDQVLKLADGRVYTAEQALENGLIDRIGTFRDAIARAKTLAGVKHAEVVAYARPYGYVGNYYNRVPAGAPQTQVNMLNVDLTDLSPGAHAPFMYLWAPGG